MLKKAQNEIYSYIITRDFGFAPNPFYGCCTLATCKPQIRLHAHVGDWIIGCMSNAQQTIYRPRIIYIMQVSEKISFDDYWNNPHFSCKKSVRNGSLKQWYGDNIYHYDNGSFIQEPSHHSYVDGTQNTLNSDKDEHGKYVLISYKFWYWGTNAIPCPQNLYCICSRCRNYCKPQISEDFIHWITSYKGGYLGDPIEFDNGFRLYNGKD